MKKIWIAGLIAGVLAAASLVGAGLMPSVTPFLGANVLASGGIHVSSEATAPLAQSNMAPGDTVTGALTVANPSPFPIRYAMRTSTTGSSPVTDALQLTVKTGVATCTDEGFASDGNEVYSGPLAASAIGDASPGSQGGTGI